MEIGENRCGFSSSIFTVTVLFVFSAISASAISFILTTDHDGVSGIFPGDQVVVTVTLDTSDLAGGTDSSLGWAFSISFDSSKWFIIGGTQNPLVYDFVDPALGTLGGVPQISPLPPNNNIDPDVIRMGVWAGSIPFSEQANTLRWGVEQLATVTLESTGFFVIGGRTTTLSPFFASGDVFELNGDLLTSGVTFNSVTFIPEPTTTLLLGLGLAGLAATGRRAAQ